MAITLFWSPWYWKGAPTRGREDGNPNGCGDSLAASCRDMQSPGAASAFLKLPCSVSPSFLGCWGDCPALFGLLQNLSVAR